MGAGGHESFAGQKTCVGVDQSGYMYIYSVSCGVSGAARGGRASEEARLRAATARLRARFVHIDCDLYSSTKTVLTLLAPAIRAGSVLSP